MRVWSGQIFRLLKCLAPFDCACVILGTSSYLSSSAFSSCEDRVPLSCVKHFWSRLWQEIIAKTTLQAVGMSKSALMPTALFPSYLPWQRQTVTWPLLFSVPTPVFLPNKQVNPHLAALLHRFWQYQAAVQLLGQRLSSVIVSTSLSSHWHHVNCAVTCFAMASPVWKDFIKVESVFHKEHVIQRQNALFFLVPNFWLLLVLFKGILNCCFLCASTQSYRFSITRAWCQRMCYQGKDFFFFLLQIEENCFVFMICRRLTQLLVKTKRKKKSLFWVFLYGLKT